jgi:hypothetical protein
MFIQSDREVLRMTDDHWPAAVDEILGGDQCVVLAHRTPARGVVLTPVTNFALRDREAGTVTVNSSIGMWRKLELLQRDPQVALAFHTRAHGFGGGSEYVLVQGRASLSSLVDRDAWLEPLGERWERFSGQPRDLGPLWDWWLRVYHWRVNIEIAVERVTAWPDLACRGTPAIYGAPPPPLAPASQPAPARGEGPRIDHVRAAKRAARLPDVLLGWVGDDGLPVVVPVAVTGSEQRGILLEAAAGLIPPGERRAGLLAHWFSRYVVGQRQRKHTGWLQARTAEPRLIYAPHTEAGYSLPPSRLAFNLGAGFLSRRGLREAVRAGFLDGGAR